MPRGKPSRKRPAARGASDPLEADGGSTPSTAAADDATPVGESPPDPTPPAAKPSRKSAPRSTAKSKTKTKSKTRSARTARKEAAGEETPPLPAGPAPDAAARHADASTPQPVIEPEPTPPESIDVARAAAEIDPPVAVPAADETMWGEDGPELGSLLADAHRAVLEREERRVAERRQAERRARPPRAVPDAPWLAAAAVSWLLVVFALLSPPAFMRAPAPAPFRPAPALREPSLRYGIWLARQRVEHFTRREGRLPSFLGETGMLDDAIRMEVDGERSYRLIATIGERQLVLSDRMAADSFLGSSLDQLRGSE